MNITEKDIEKLKEEIPCQWRIASTTKTGKGQAVAYIDARDVMDLLDKVLGPSNWQDTYKKEGDLLIAGAGIKINGEWVWKYDTGSESNTEKEKGLVSDAFKRAWVKWGVGRFLYEKDMIRVDVNVEKRPIDDKGNTIWDLTKYINGLLKEKSTKEIIPSYFPSGEKLNFGGLSDKEIKQSEDNLDEKKAKDDVIKKMYGLLGKGGKDKDEIRASLVEIATAYGYEKINELSIEDLNNALEELEKHK